ncbi:MAG: winged helix-turn-helix domain-containing protein [Solirubrobacterales bacterium]
MASQSKGKEQNSRSKLDQRLIKALAHPLRADILSILNERVASPNELAKTLGEGLSQVSYHVKVLHECDCIELVKTEPRRGAVEHYYRATARAFLADDDWERLPEVVRSGLRASLLRGAVEDAMAALREGTFEARTDSHMSWTPLIVDGEGWKELTSLLAETLEGVLDIQTQSAGRLAQAGAEGIPAAVTIVGYEAFPEGSKMRAKA